MSEIATRLKLLQLDWSGTTSNDMDPIYYINTQVFPLYNVELPPRKQMFDGSTGTLRTYLAKHKRNISKEEEKALFFKYFDEAHEKGIRPFVYPKAPEIIRRIHAAGIPITVVSTHPEKYLVREAEEYGILNCFREIRAGLERKKDALLELCDEFNVSPADSVFVGDITFDMVQSQQAGIPFIALSHGYQSREVLLAANPSLDIADNWTELEERLLI